MQAQNHQVRWEIYMDGHFEFLSSRYFILFFYDLTKYENVFQF